MRLKAASVSFIAALALAPPALAQVGQPVGPWDGENPFNCTNQDVGTGTDFPHPKADPFCVEFDKTNQNVTDFGIVDFLSQEPARTGIAATKCFYFQQDHWTGSVVQGQGPELWHWDGDYFFDEAKGIGGVSVHNFRIGGQPADMTPYVPAAYRPYFHANGGGGVIVTQDTRSVPRCAAKVDTPKEKRAVYRSASAAPRCTTPGGTVRGRRVGHVELGEARGRIRARLGDPRRTRDGVDRWCVVGDAVLHVAYRRLPGKAKTGPRAALILSSSRGHTVRGIGRGMRLAAARHRARLDYRDRVHGRRIFEVPARGRRAFVGARHGEVRWVALARPRLRTAAIETLFRHAL